jgi:quinol monooxygenase YgiN
MIAGKHGGEMMIHSAIRLEMELKKRDEAIDILVPIVKRTRNKVGCISCFVYKNIEDESQILIEQFWRNDDDMRNHLRSQDYQQLLLIVEMALKKPEIQFNTVAHTTTGMEMIQKARMSKEVNNKS